MICNICTARIPDKSVVCPECGAPVRNRKTQQRYDGMGSADMRQEQGMNRPNMRPNYPDMNRQQDRYAYSGQQRPPMYRNEVQPRGNMRPQQPSSMPNPNMMRPDGRANMMDMPSRAPMSQQQQHMMPQRFPQNNIQNNNGQARYMNMQQPYGAQNQSVNIMQPQRQAPSNAGSIDISKPANLPQNIAAAKGAGAENNPAVPENEKPYTTAGFIGTMIVGAIPVIGWILYLVWCFSKKVNKSKKAFCRAAVILFFIVALVASIGVILLYFFSYDTFNQILHNFNSLI